MNLDRLRAVQAEEREADSLRSLPDTFYREVAGYIEELREERARAAAAAEDPFGDEDVRRLTDEIETAEEVAEAIYERRVGKLVKRASLAAAGMPADEEGLTTEEAALFDDLVAQIEGHRAEVLATFDAGEERDGSGAEVTSPGGVADDPEERADSEAASEGDDPAIDATEAMGGGADRGSGESADDRSTASAVSPEEETSGPGRTEGDADDSTDDADPAESTDGGESRADPERVTLRITRDVGEVFGVDERTYELAAEDVVTLPAANAKPLIERDAAEQID